LRLIVTIILAKKLYLTSLRLPAGSILLYQESRRYKGKWQRHLKLPRMVTSLARLHLQCFALLSWQASALEPRLASAAMQLL